VPTKVKLRGGWNVSTISRILKDEKYTGTFIWNRTTSVKDPLTGKMKQVDRPKEEWVTQQRPEMRIITDADRAAADRALAGDRRRLPEPTEGEEGLSGDRPPRSYVDSHPTHLLSGASASAASCSGGAIALVSGKGSGYYGCLNAARRSCENRQLIARKRIEEKVLAALEAEVMRADVLEAVYTKTAAKIRELFAHVPEELRVKKLELNRAQTRVHNFIEFIASGRATPGLADALAQAEEQTETLTADVASLETAKDDVFTPPPRAWIEDRLAKLREVLGQRTELSALALRRLTGPVTLTPQKPEVGRAYFQACCRFDSLNLLHVAERGSNSLRWWRRRESNPGPRGINCNFVHVRSRCVPSDWVRRFGRDLSLAISAALSRAPSRDPALVMTPSGYQDDLASGRCSAVIKPREQRCRCRSHL
jgi:hypothetical protein